MQLISGEREKLDGRILVQCLGPVEMIERLFGLALFGKGEREIAVCCVIPLGDAQRIAPQGFIVVPVAQLSIRETP